MNNSNNSDNESTGATSVSNAKRTFEESQGHHSGAPDNSDLADTGGSDGDHHPQSGADSTLTRSEIEEAVQAYRAALLKRAKLQPVWDPIEPSSEEEDEDLEGASCVPAVTPAVRGSPVEQANTAVKGDARLLAAYFPKLRQWDCGRLH
jgi:hypothetical protein